MIKVVNLMKIYKPKKGVSVTALNGINLEFSEKGLVFLLGKSGSGKSTLLNLLGGLDKYTDGDIIIKGKSTKDFTQSNFDSYRNTFIGFIFQEFNILEEYSVGKNIGLALELQHRPADKVAIEELLEKVDLEGYFDRKPNELSGGQKQRIAIARALIKNPDIIMADEPTGALDSNTGKQVFDTLKKLAQEKLVIVVSHDRENAELYADRIIELADGQVIADRLRSESTNELEKVQQSVLVVDEKLIRVKAGATLTVEDIAALNVALSKTADDVYISFDGKLNTSFSKKTSQMYDGQATFTETEPENIKTLDYDPAKFSLTKSRLPVKDSIKMGASSLTHKKFRLIMSIFLSFITFAMVGFCVSAAMFNFMKVEFQTAVDSNSGCVTIASEGQYYNGGLSDYDTSPITTEQIKNIEELTNNKALYFYGGENSSLMYINLLSNLMKKPEDGELTMYDQLEISNILIINSLNDVGLTPIGNSKLPTATNEIAITDYIADLFIKYGYKFKQDVNDSMEITEASQLIGKKLDGNGYVLIISGVFKTPMDKNDYSSYKNTLRTNGIADTFFTSHETLMGMAFVGPQFMEASGANDTCSTDLGLLSITKGDKLIMANTITSIVETKISDDSNAPIGTQLSGNQIALEKWSIATLFGTEYANDPLLFLALSKEERTVRLTYVNGMEPINLEIVAFSDNATWVVSPEVIQKIADTDIKYRELNSNFGKELLGNSDNDTICEFGQSIMRMRSIGSTNQSTRASENSDGTFPGGIYWGKTGDVQNPPKMTLADNEIVITYRMMRALENRNQASVEEIIDAFDGLTSDVIYNVDFYGIINAQALAKYGGEKMKIVGVYLIDDQTVFVSDNLFAQKKSAATGPRKFMIKIPDNYGDQQKLLKYVMSQKTPKAGYGGVDNILRFITQSYSIITQAQVLISGAVEIIKYFAIILCVFAALMMMNFITTSISYKKKEIGVLRAIGARSSDVFKIFFAESGIIALINIVLASIALGIVSIAINSSLKISVLVFSPLPYLAIAGLALLVAFVSTVIPTQKIAKKKPIDAINNK